VGERILSRMPQNALYDTIGRNYDVTRRADPGLGTLLRERLNLAPDLARARHRLRHGELHGDSRREREYSA
jgi:hypothetical protein